MKGYILSPAELAGEARMLADAGADCVTIMELGRTMFPAEAAEYVRALKSAVSIPVASTATATWGSARPTPWPPPRPVRTR